MSKVEIAPTTDLSVLRDRSASRLAHVSVSEGRIEIALTRTDHAWVEDALDVIEQRHPIILVVVCPE